MKNIDNEECKSSDTVICWVLSPKVSPLELIKIFEEYGELKDCLVSELFSEMKTCTRH